MYYYISNWPLFAASVANEKLRQQRIEWILNVLNDVTVSHFPHLIEPINEMGLSTIDDHRFGKNEPEKF